MPAPMLEKAAQGALDTFYRKGFNGIIEKVPESDREKVLGFAVPMIQLTLTELRDVVRERSGLPAVKYEGSGASKDEQWVQRSEERRVGKECVSTCRSRWWPYH